MKRFVCLLALLLALVMPFAAAYAADTLEIKALDILEDGTVRVALFASPEGNLKAEDFSILLGDKAIQPAAVKKYEDGGMGTTWLLVADQKNNAPVGKMKDLFNGIVKGMKENDNAAVIEAGALINAVKLTDNQSTLSTAIQALKDYGNNTKAITNLDIVTALTASSTLEDVRPHVNVVIVTSGRALNENGKTHEEVLTLAKKSEATIYTVAFMEEETREKTVSAFEEIADSCGDGLTQRFEHRKHNAEAAILEMLNHEEKFRVIEFKPENADWKSLQVTYKKDDVILTDSTDLTDEQVVALATPTPEPTATPEPTPEPTPVPKHIVVKDWVTENIIVVAAGAVLVVLVIVLIVMLIGKKKQSAESEEKPSGTTAVDPSENGSTEVIHEHEKTILVRLEQIDVQHGRVYTGEMRNELIIGREAPPSQLAIPDMKISGKHIKLSYRSGEMYLQDLGSRNGTKVNGMDVTGMVPLHQQDKICIGLTTLRITWR